MLNLIKSLEEKLRIQNDLYNTSGKPEMTDDEYDAAIRLLTRLDPENPFLKVVGSHKVRDEKKSYHLIKMGTLRKFHDLDSVKKELSTKFAGHDSIYAAPKYDGFGLELTYVNGVLSSAVTRGDGVIGEDITKSAERIKSIPKTISSPVPLTIIRGEVIAPRKSFRVLESKGYTAMRNAVPGIMRSDLTSEITGTISECLDFVAYEYYLPNVSQEHWDSREKYNQLMKQDGFITEFYQKFDLTDGGIKDLTEYHDYIESSVKSKTSTYEYDGIVIKSCYCLESGDSYLCPEYSFAWKFKSKYESTTLREIEFTMGVTGVFTPIAIFDDVEFQGARLSRASLGSYDRMQSLIKDGLSIGCVINVSRRGDIIPYVEGVVCTTEESKPIVFPDHCPYCGSPLGYTDADMICPNPYCLEKVILRVLGYVGSVKIKGMGRSMVEHIVRDNDIHMIYDLYNVDINQYTGNIKSKLQDLQSKKLTELQLLTAYPFDNISQSTWKSVLAAGYDINNIMISCSNNILETLISKKPIRGLGFTKTTNLIDQLYRYYTDLYEIYKLVVRG